MEINQNIDIILPKKSTIGKEKLQKRIAKELAVKQVFSGVFAQQRKCASSSRNAFADHEDLEGKLQRIGGGEQFSGSFKIDDY